MSQSLKDVVRAGIAGRLAATNSLEFDGIAAFKTPEKEQKEEAEGSRSPLDNGPRTWTQGAAEEPSSEEIQIMIQTQETKQDESEAPGPEQLQEVDAQPADQDPDHEKVVAACPEAPDPGQPKQQEEIERKDTTEFEATDPEDEVEAAKVERAKKRPAAAGIASGAKKQKMDPNPKPKSKPILKRPSASSAPEERPAEKKTAAKKTEKKNAAEKQPAAKKPAAKEQEPKNEAESKEPLDTLQGSVLPMACWRWSEPEDEDAPHVREFVSGDWKAEASNTLRRFDSK